MIINQTSFGLDKTVWLPESGYQIESFDGLSGRVSGNQPPCEINKLCNVRGSTFIVLHDSRNKVIIYGAEDIFEFLKKSFSSLVQNLKRLQKSDFKRSVTAKSIASLCRTGHWPFRLCKS